MSSETSGITATELRFSWPDGTPVFEGLTFTVGPGRSGLIGRNGSGKSTLLRLIAGELRPQGGSVRHVGSLGYLPQDLTLQVGRRVDEILGIAQVRRALAELESGNADGRIFDAIGDHWDVAERAETLLAELGLDVDLDRRIAQMSGGEAVMLGLAAVLMREPGVLLLDEPTNNLDREARSRLAGALSSYRGTFLMVSHDVELLEQVDRIGDLTETGLEWHGGGFSAYLEARSTAQDAAERAVRTAAADVRRQKRELSDAHIKLARRRRYGQKMWDSKREPKVVMGERKRQAQVSAGKHRGMHEERLFTARGELAEAEEALPNDEHIRVDLPDTKVPAGRSVLSMEGVTLRNGAEVDLELRGPERVALLGRNGSGKSTLLHTVTGEMQPMYGTCSVHVPTRILPQRIDILDETLTVVENLERFSPRTDNNGRRALLARFLFRGSSAEQPASTLSGGERFRAALATLLLSEPAPQLLLLDEPTNSLDLASVDQFVSALDNYRGALIVASHDEVFLGRLGITRWVQLSQGKLTDAPPPTTV